MHERGEQRIHRRLQEAFEELGRRFQNASEAERRELIEQARRITAEMELLFNERRARQAATLRNLG